MPDLIGKTLGQYQILREIGRGGMAIVYEAYQPVLARRVAIKVLLPHLSFDPLLVQRFLQEARSAAALTQPNIVTIHDVVEQDGQYYIVMQYLPGQSLSQLIQQAGRVPLARAARIVAQIASALDYAHSRGVVHRDVKPANIIVGPDDQATLTDFGIARAAEASRLTYAGAVMGTPEYMSPEQAQGESVGPPSDIYALGIVLYEMLSGQLPFNAPSTPALLYKQVHERPSPVRTYAPELPAGVEKVLGKALAKRPGERFRSAAELAAALRALPTSRVTPVSPARGVRPITPISSEATRLIRPGEAHAADRPCARSQASGEMVGAGDGGRARDAGRCRGRSVVASRLCASSDDSPDDIGCSSASATGRDRADQHARSTTDPFGACARNAGSHCAADHGSSCSDLDAAADGHARAFGAGDPVAATSSNATPGATGQR